MAFKPNYNQQRAERNRAKEQKKQEKLQKRQEESERRKAERDPDAPDGSSEADGETGTGRSEEHTSELQSLMRISYAVFCLKKKTNQPTTPTHTTTIKQS